MLGVEAVTLPPKASPKLRDRIGRYARLSRQEDAQAGVKPLRPHDTYVLKAIEAARQIIEARGVEDCIAFFDQEIASLRDRVDPPRPSTPDPSLMPERGLL